MAVEKAPVWTFPPKPKRLGRWYGKGPADRSPVGPGPAAARRASSAMVPVRRSAGSGTWKRDGIMRKEDGPIRHKENGAARFQRPCRESNPEPLGNCERRGLSVRGPGRDRRTGRAVVQLFITGHRRMRVPLQPSPPSCGGAPRRWPRPRRQARRPQRPCRRRRSRWRRG